MTSLPPLITFWFGLLAIAASSDVAARRVPNALVVLVAGTSIALRIDSGRDPAVEHLRDLAQVLAGAAERRVELGERLTLDDVTALA